MSRSFDMAKRFLTDPVIRDSYLTRLGIYNFMSDKAFLKHKFKLLMGYSLDLENPQTFNEKLQWLKLHDRKPEYSRMVDKYEAKAYIAEMIGEEYIIPTLGIWERFEDIDFEKLPDQFVLKCTHDSGGLVICRNKANLDLDGARRKINASLKRKYYYANREWPYKNVKPRIIAEAYMEDRNAKEPDVLTDYKFFCFHGKPEIVYISQDKAKEPYTDFFDMEFNHLPIRMKDPNSDSLPEKPPTFEKMKELARILSAGHYHLRVDFYNINGRIYAGELTFYHCGGFAMIHPDEWNTKLGSLIHLPHEK